MKGLLKEAKQRIPPVLMMLEDPREKNGGLGCSFCGGLGHTIVDCPKIDKDARRVAGSHRPVGVVIGNHCMFFLLSKSKSTDNFCSFIRNGPTIANDFCLFRISCQPLTAFFGLHLSMHFLIHSSATQKPQSIKSLLKLKFGLALLVLDVR